MKLGKYQASANGTHVLAPMKRVTDMHEFFESENNWQREDDWYYLVTLSQNSNETVTCGTRTLGTE
jgi:hypothetical protein